MFVTPLLMTLFPVLNPASSIEARRAPIADEVPTLLVGDKAVKGKRLKAYDARWTTDQMEAGKHIQEIGRVERIDGRKCYIRNQVWPMQNGLELHAEVVLDAATLQTVSFQKEVKGLPPGAGIGAMPVFSRWEFDGASYTRTLRHGGADAVVDEGQLEAPMFDGGALGLIIAALPLKDGYEARIPIAMTLQLSPDFTLYTVHVRVVGQESFERPKGKDVDAWVVEVDWIDHGTDNVSSKGGADQPGGAYYVVPKPPKGFPHVPRYANDGMVLQVAFE